MLIERLGSGKPVGPRSGQSAFGVNEPDPVAFMACPGLPDDLV